ncbi:endonuclease domain-containing protein [Novosphingobium colocasiae]|uniref:endonuclease domain-containing protein n=1 Tax=Novosphingobium colocasiae TaxID=1256513 RepID=UPI0035ADAAE3
MPDFKPRNTARARQLRNVATPAERLLWRYLARGQLGAKFSRQMPVGPYFADFLCRELRLAIELDGHSHNLRAEYDTARDRWMAEQGLRVLRFPNAVVLRETEMVVAAVLAEVTALRGARDGPPRCD